MNDKDIWIQGSDVDRKTIEEYMKDREQGTILSELPSFLYLMMQYRCAIREMESKLDVLNDEFSLRHERNPFESIESRVKKPRSIIEKMRRKGFELTVENIEEK